MTYCSSCGTENSTNKFCNSCGRPLSVDAKPNLNTSQAGSSRAMWAHLAPLLLAVFAFTIGSFMPGDQYLSPPNGDFVSILGLPFLQIIPLLVLWIPPLIVRTSSKSSEFDRRHAGASLNNQISLFLYIGFVVLLGVFTTIGTFSNSSNFSINGFAQSLMVVVSMFLVLGVLGMVSLVSSILGSVAASNGKEFRYPLAIRFLK